MQARLHRGRHRLLLHNVECPVSDGIHPIPGDNLIGVARARGVRGSVHCNTTRNSYLRTTLVLLGFHLVSELIASTYHEDITFTSQRTREDVKDSRPAATNHWTGSLFKYHFEFCLLLSAERARPKIWKEFVEL